MIKSRKSINDFFDSDKDIENNNDIADEGLIGLSPQICVEMEQSGELDFSL